MTLEEALSALHLRVPLGMRLGLGPMEAACAATGHPERAFEVVHVAGTNGKGSTCAMVAAIARAAGLRVGLYTSPHLCRFAERISIDGEPITDGELVVVLAQALEHDLSFFEVATLAAFLAFRRAGAELAVVEVGLGGRLDATNVVTPRVTAITNLALDHQAVLGGTLEEIAGEKAGIAKPGVPMILGATAEIARAAAIARGARIVAAGELPDVPLALEGPHQRENARVAWAIADVMGWPEDARREGLRTATWPGRIERIELADGTWILDGAHNPDGARALATALAGDEIGAVVFGALADKSWREMLSEVVKLGGERVYVQPKGRAAVTGAELRAVAEGVEAATIGEGLREARRRAGARAVVVCGSLYLVGEARAGLLGLGMDPVVAL